MTLNASSFRAISKPAPEQRPEAGDRFDCPIRRSQVTIRRIRKGMNYRALSAVPSAALPAVFAMTWPVSVL